MKKIKPKELDRIVKRIDAIEKKRPNHKEILEFFKDIIKEQYKIKPLIKVESGEINEETAKHQMKEGFPLIDKNQIKLDVDSATTLFKNICSALNRKNKKIAAEIKAIRKALRKKELDLQELFKKLVDGDKAYLDSIEEKVELNKWLLLFLARNSINTVLEAYADRLKGYAEKVEQELWWKGYCPVCGSEPVIGELRQDAGERFLTCSSCGFQWRFKRLSCPFCGNEDQKRHRYFHTEADGKAYRVDVCEECKKYIKTIDIKELKGEVIPVVEDMGTIHLDIIAQNEGYQRGVSNIIEIEKMGTA